jgi:hypothetical protein
MTRIGFLGGALVLSALGLAACTGTGDDNSVAPPLKNDAGPDSAAPAGDASLPVEAGGDATFPAEAGDATSSAEAGGDATFPAEAGDASHAGDAAGGDAGADASTRSFALFVGTDFSSAELAVVGLHPDTIDGRLPLADQDSVPYASAGYGFVLEHGLGQVIELDRAQPWMAKTTIDVNDSPDATAYASNPRTVLVTTGTKAYVARYASNVVRIVDVASGAVTGNLDLSAYADPNDPDGLVDVQDAAYDAQTGRAYFLLQRINQFDFGPPPDYVGACLWVHGEIVGVDVTNDSFVDLNGAAAGTAIDLLGDNPASLTADFANGRLIVADSGCYETLDAGTDGGALPRIGRGIESVNVAAGMPTWLYQTSVLDRLSGLVWVDGTRAFVNQGSSWYAWNPTQTALGGAVTNFPQAPFYDGAGRIVGLSSATGTDGGTQWAVVALGVDTSQLTTIADSPFQSVVPAPGYGVTSALLH